MGIEAEIIEGEDPAEVEQKVRTKVAKLTQLSCSMNSPELMDHLVEEIHSGGKQWEQYVTLFEHYMNEKCAKSEELDDFWSKQDENTNDTYMAAFLLAVLSFVGIIAIAMSVFMSLKFLARRFSPQAVQMTRFHDDSNLKYQKVGQEKNMDQGLIKGVKVVAYGATEDES